MARSPAALAASEALTCAVPAGAAPFPLIRRGIRSKAPPSHGSHHHKRQDHASVSHDDSPMAELKQADGKGTLTPLSTVTAALPVRQLILYPYAVAAQHPRVGYGDPRRKSRVKAGDPASPEPPLLHALELFGRRAADRARGRRVAFDRVAADLADPDRPRREVFARFHGVGGLLI